MIAGDRSLDSLNPINHEVFIMCVASSIVIAAILDDKDLPFK